MTDLDTIATDGDTGRIRNEAARAPSSDPGRDHVALAVAFVAHEQSDARRFAAGEARWKRAAALGGLLLALAAWGAEEAWRAHAEAAAGRAQIDDMHERIVRIEQQLDRLMERSDDR